ncbi:MAG: hypothetical protein JSS81_01600 [Acidobacteria bacterium]|nr:hypothetical protein [Acidobacteriota bacterium]
MKKILLILTLMLFFQTIYADEAVYSNNVLQITIDAALSVRETKLHFELVDAKDNPVLSGDSRAVPKSENEILMTIALTQNLDPNKDYKVKISSGDILWKTIDVSRGLTAKFESAREFEFCKGGIPMFLDGIARDGTNNAEVLRFWTEVTNYLKDENLKDKMIVQTSNGDKLETLNLKQAKLVVESFENVQNFGRTKVCLAPASKPESGSFNISVQFKDNPPFSLGAKFTGPGLSWGGATAIKSSSALPDSPDEREIERNLDLGVSFTTSVKPDETTGKKMREKRGILDVRFAPVFDLVKYRGGPRIWKITPFFLNANVATGRITKDTISLNRVIVGSEVELRLIPGLKKPGSGETSDTDKPLDFYRLKFKGNHSSDRDFKQKEITGTFEFQPVFGALYRPRDTRWYFVDDVITSTPTEPNKVVKYRTFGWQILPKAGFEFGKTYSRRNPAEALEATDLVKRLYVGLDMSFDISSHLTLTFNDTIYARYELESNRLKNHFKGEAYARFGSPFRGTSNGIFVAFEKGDAPPFTSTVNVFKIGYRIQSNQLNRLF